MPDIFTVTEERPDLADVTLNLPENLIALKVIPTVPVTIVSSKFRYYVPVADVAAQQDRSVGVAPTKTRVANAEGTFTCAEIIKRAAVSPDEAKNFGGIEVADEAGSRYAKKQVALALEEKAAAAFLDVAALDAFDPVNLLKQVNTANAQLKSYYGKLSLVASEQALTNMFNALVQEARVGTMFVRIVSGTAPGVAIEGLTQAQRFAALAAYMGVKQVFAGLDDVWGSTAARAASFALARLDDGAEELVYKYEPVFARRFQFLPDGVQPWSIRSIADHVNVDNLYDAQMWQETKKLNAGACVVFDGVA